MVIVESSNQYKQLCNLINEQNFILIPVFANNRTHPAFNSISILYFNFFNEEYIAPINHPDCINLENSWDLISKILSSKMSKFVVDKRDFQHYLKSELDNTWKDIQLLDYINNGELTVDFEELTPAHQFLNRRFHRNLESNLIIPVTKHIEYLQDNGNKSLEIIQASDVNSETFNSMNTTMLNVLYNMESNGIQVNNGLRKKDFVYDNFAYYKYNPYTITNRPSCTYGGFNFIGMSKEDGSRKQFVSRFKDDGMMLLIDYDACHFYLMADLVGEVFNEHPYDALGKFYFNKQEPLTQEEHQQSKQLSFNVIYGGIPDEFLIIPFYEKIRKFIFDLYKSFKSNGYFETKFFKRKMYSHKLKNIVPYTLFNYYMQTLETESHMIILNELFDLLKQYETKIVLYIYDSVLIDFKISEGKELIDKIVSILQQNNKFPVSISWGTNYHELNKLS